MNSKFSFRLIASGQVFIGLGASMYAAQQDAYAMYRAWIAEVRKDLN